MTYREIAPPTDEELRAARAYYAESGFFHLAAQGAHNKVLDGFLQYQEFLRSGKLLALCSATSKYELTRSITVFSGHGNSVGAVGALGKSDPRSLTGLTWQYAGFISSSTQRDVAETAMGARVGITKAFLQFQLPIGFRLFPMEVLGADCTDEGEFLLPAHVPFSIIEATCNVNVLHLVLAPKPPV